MEDIADKIQSDKVERIAYSVHNSRNSMHRGSDHTKGSFDNTAYKTADASEK